MNDVSGSLANGNQFRLGPTSIELFSPAGVELHHIERGDISMYARFGNSIRIVTSHGFSVELPATSDADARLLEEHLRRIRSGTVPTQPGKHTERSSRAIGQAAAGASSDGTGGFEWSDIARPAVVLAATYATTLVVGLALIFLVLSVVYR